VKEMLTTLMEGYTFRADQKLQKINFVADGTGYMVHADAGKIRQVLSNLIDNAMKYSKNKGMIDVRLFKNNETKKIMVSVKDDGIGMSKDTLDKLFKKFSRAEGVQKVYTEGVGLGLYVASEMMKAHNGRIWAHSEGEGKGSIFFVEMNAMG
jgi:signal transduction histidine kinase